MKIITVSLFLVSLQAGRTESQQCIMGNCQTDYCNYDECSRCKYGHHLVKGTGSNRDYCRGCPSSCSVCEGYEYCSGCRTGYHGPLCGSQCTGCNQNICDKDIGSCTYGCFDGYYQEADGRCSQCPSGCSLCSGSDSCSRCKYEHSWGGTCQYTCGHCPTCSKSDGCSSGCDNGYYQNNNKDKGGYECLQCPDNCISCSAIDKCDSCNIGYWGTTCQHECNHCSTCRQLSGCLINSCNTGYYRTYSTTKKGNVCNQCPEKCISCSSQSDCQSCQQGHWGTTCVNSCPNHCETCISNTLCLICKSGYWGSKCRHSCTGCYNNICDKSEGCTSGCISNGYYQYKYWNEYRCYRCRDACETCNNSASCSTCPQGYVGSKCEHDCRACNGKICDTITGLCTYTCASGEYFKMDSSGTGCVKCPVGCSKCSSALQCTACVTGKWGKTCDKDCPENCLYNACSNDLGFCSNGCVNGFFDQVCSSDCLPGCKSCNGKFNCLECKTGTFSKDNSGKCECNAYNCSRKDGNVCQECSDNTWYPESHGCCPCSTICKDNICSNDGTCIDCIDKKYGTNCELHCKTKCTDSLCYRNGSCISCSDKRFFGPTCSLICWNTIPKCNSCYGLNSDTLTCTRCYTGWYAHGHVCTACSGHCISTEHPKCDQSTGVCKGHCETGWFGERCDINCNVTNCQTCLKEDPNICKECADGFYSDTRASCFACPRNCLSETVCNRYNGSCSDGCNKNWSGERCDIPCPTGCRQCDQFNQSSCSLCKEDFYGVSCKNVCSSGCLTRRQSQTCYKRSGICNLGCKEGFWDNLCDKQCGKGCSGNVCNRTTGNCLSKCLETHFGQMCDDQCNDNCVNTTGRSCNETDGYCLDGCQVGWFGKQCNNECGQNCKKRICNRNNASCTYGCIDGYSGFMCSQALLLDDPNTAAIGGGAGAGVAVLVTLVVIVVVVVLRRRKMSLKMKTMKRQSVEKNHSFRQTEPAGPEYSNINEARIEKQTSELPGTTNLVYANAPVRMSDISEKNKAVSGNAKPARPTSEDYLKEVEIDDDVEVDDDEADIVGVVNDTYYNMGVAVAKLAEYIKHKPIEDIVSDFDKIPKGLLKSYKEAKKAKNTTKNKYRAIYPYDENRVVLLGSDGDYMNASYIDGYNRPKEYIASSGNKD